MSFPLNIFDDTEKILNSTFLGTNNSNVGVQHYQQHNFNNINNFQSNFYQFNTSEMEQIPTIPSPTNYNTFFHNDSNHQNHLSTLAVAATSAAAATFKNLTSHNVITNVTNFVLTTATNALINNIDLGSNGGGVRFDIGTTIEGTAGNLSATNSYLFNNNNNNNNNNINNNRNDNFTGILYGDNDVFENQYLNSTIINGSMDHAPQLSKSALIRCIVLSAMAIVSLLGNTATMWNIYKTRMTKRPSRHNWSAIYSLIFHLSIADVLVTGFCIIGEAAWCYTVQWLASEFACKSVKFFQMFSLYLSTYVLVLIGVDRWIAVKYPMKSLNMAKRCYRLLGGAYVLSFVLSIPQFFIFRVARGPFIEDFYQCVTHGFYTAEWQEQLYTTFTLFFTFIIPLCILIVTYLSTFRTISGSEKMFQGSKLAVYTSKPAAQTNRQRLIHKAKMKSLRISVVIIVAFLICWTPYNVMMIIFMFLNPDKRLGEDLQSGIFFFGMSNSLVNPLIYGAFHLCPLKRNNSQYAHYSLTRDNSHSYQRSPSLLTATTQIDSTGRHHTFKHRSSYYQRNGSMIRRDQFDLTNSPIAKKLQTVNVGPGSIQAGNDVSIHLLQNNSNNSNNNSVTNTQREYLLRQTSFNGNNHLKTINNTNISNSTQLPMNSGGTGVSYNNGISYHHQLHHLHQNNSSVINDLSKKPKINNNNISSV